MKHLKLLCICMLTMFSSRNNYDEQTDSRLEFVGSYRITRTEAKFSEGEVVELPFIMDGESKIKFELDTSSNGDELIVDMTKYIENVYNTYFLSLGAEDISVNVDVNKNIIAKISENTFEIDNAAFRVTLINLVEVEYMINNRMHMKGQFIGNSLEFNFNIELSNNLGKGILKGVSKGKKG